MALSEKQRQAIAVKAYSDAKAGKPPPFAKHPKGSVASPSKASPKPGKS